MSITVELYLDKAWRSVEAQQPIVINEALHNGLTSATSSCRVNIIPNSTIKNYLLGLENDDADIRIKDGATVLFQGLLRKNFTIRKLEQRQDLYGLEAVGYLIKLDRKVKEDKQYISKSVSYIVENLLSELGINYSLPSITNTINNLYIKRGESYRIIEQLLKEYGYILYVDKAGTARAIEISPATIATTKTFNDTNTLDAIELNKKEQDKERIEVEYKQQKTATSGIVFSDTTNAQSVYKCFIQLAAGKYLGGQQYVYADLKYNGNKIIALTSHTLDISADTGITVLTNKLEGNKVKLSIKNTSGITKTIYKLDIIGSGIVYEESAGKEIATSNSNTNKIETIQAKYIFTSTNAQSYAQKLLNYYKYSDFVYTLSSKTDATLGEQVLLDHAGIGSIKARVIEKKIDYQTGKRQYKLEGISEYSAESSGSEPSYTAPDPVNNQAITLTYPEQPTNNVTNVTASYSENADGTAAIEISFTYTQGEKPATQFLCYVLRSFSTPGSIDYYNDQAIAKPYIADGSYSIKFSVPTRAGSAPIHYKIGVIAANGAKLHASGAVIPTGWSDKVVTGGITYDSNNYWDLDTGEFRCGNDNNYIHIKPGDGTFDAKFERLKIQTEDVSTIGRLKISDLFDVKQSSAINPLLLTASGSGEGKISIEKYNGLLFDTEGAYSVIYKNGTNALSSLSIGSFSYLAHIKIEVLPDGRILFLYQHTAYTSRLYYAIYTTTWSVYYIDISPATFAIPDVCYLGDNIIVVTSTQSNKLYFVHISTNTLIGTVDTGIAHDYRFCVEYLYGDKYFLTYREYSTGYLKSCIFDIGTHTIDETYTVYSDTVYYPCTVKANDGYIYIFYRDDVSDTGGKVYLRKYSISLKTLSKQELIISSAPVNWLDADVNNNLIILAYYYNTKRRLKYYSLITKTWSSEIDIVTDSTTSAVTAALYPNTFNVLYAYNYIDTSIYYVGFRKYEINNLYYYEKLGAGIIETGSNSNGTWIKFSDGTMMCYGSFITAGNGGTDYTGYRTYPVTFTTKPDYTIGNAWSGYHGATIVSANQIALVNDWTDKFFYAVRFIGATSSSYNIVYNWTAIGRWK